MTVPAHWRRESSQGSTRIDGLSFLFSPDEDGPAVHVLHGQHCIQVSPVEEFDFGIAEDWIDAVYPLPPWLQGVSFAGPGTCGAVSPYHGVVCTLTPGHAGKYHSGTDATGERWDWYTPTAAP